MTSRDEIEDLDREWMEEPERHGSIPRLQLLGSVAPIAIMAGLALILFGSWLHGLGLDPRFDAPGSWCHILGTCIVLVSLFILVGYVSPRLRAHSQAKWKYENRRVQLLQDFYDDAQRAIADKVNGQPDD